MRPTRLLVLVSAVALVATGCTSGDGSSESASSPGSGGTPAAPGSGPAGSSSPGASSPGASTPGASSAAPSATTDSAPGSASSPGSSQSSATSSNGCADRIVARLTPDQRVGQLVMVGLQAGSPASSVTSVVREHNVGNVLYLGGWEGNDLVSRTSAELQRAVGPESTGGLRLLVAADQEGGAVWQLRDPSTPRLPPAVEQGRAAPAQRQAYGRQVGSLLDKVGVNVNLAPVADTVPTSIGEANQPIGRHGRQYGSDPVAVGPAVQDLVRGMHAGGVATTLKHFPGLGRVTGNTDFTAEGTDDSVATRSDPYLGPFRQGIQAGSELVMMSSARYPKIDADNQAVFSRTMITDVLRGQLGFGGVVITDDLNAKALSGVPVGERATRFVAAGGDILLTGRAADAGPMTQALLARSSTDPAFAKQVDAAVRRVVGLKVARGLAPCS